MENEWPYIRIEWFTSSKHEVRAIKKLFLTHFVGLTDLYKHYSGSSSSGSVASMNKLEFQHVLLVCRLIDIGKEKKLVERLFASANHRRSDDPGAADTASLARFEFFEALLNLACVKFNIGACSLSCLHALRTSPCVLYACVCGCMCVCVLASRQTGPPASASRRPSRSNACWTILCCRASPKWLPEVCERRCRRRPWLGTLQSGSRPSGGCSRSTPPSPVTRAYLTTATR